MDVAPYMMAAKCCEDCSKAKSSVDKNFCKMSMFSCLKDIVEDAYQLCFIHKRIDEDKFSQVKYIVDDIMAACFMCKGKKKMVYDKIKEEELDLYFQELDSVEEIIQEEYKEEIPKEGMIIKIEDLRKKSRMKGGT